MTDRIIFVCTLLLAGIYFWAITKIPDLELGDPLGPRAFPQMLGVGLLIAAAMLLAEILRDRKKTKSEKGAASVPALAWEPHYWVLLSVAAWTAVYLWAFELLGYMLATAIYLIAMMAYFNRGRWLMNGLTVVLFVIISYFAFTKLLGVSLARGIIPL